jgi:hypothetical protein
MNKPSETYDPFAINMHVLLKRHHLTRNGFANKIGASLSTVNAWLQARQLPPALRGTSKDGDATAKSLYDIVQFFNSEPYNDHISIEWLIGQRKETNANATVACKYTGLSEDAINSLRYLSGADPHTKNTILYTKYGGGKVAGILNDMVVTDKFTEMLFDLCGILNLKDNAKLIHSNKFVPSDMSIESNNDIAIRYKYEASMAFADMINDLFPTVTPAKNLKGK